MRAFTTLSAAAALFPCFVYGRAISIPVETRSAPEPRQECLTLIDAEYLVNNYAMLINSTYSATRAADILAPDFLEYSDSINFLAGVPLGQAIFTSLAAFDASQSQQQPVRLQVLSIDAVSCTNIAWRWLAYPGSEQHEVKGNNIIYAVQGDGSANGWQIGTTFVEFNSAAWNLDVGGTSIPPTQS